METPQGSEAIQVEAMDDLPCYSATARNTISSDSGQLINIESQSRQRIQGVAASGSTGTSRRTTDTVSTLDDKSNTPWLSLILTSRPYSSGLPSFVEGEPIQGRVVIDLAKPQSIDSILITVKGLIYCNVYETTTFYSQSKPLWKAADDDAPRSSILGIRTTKTKSNMRLEGRHVWQFSFSMPHEFEVRKLVARENKLQSTELIPPTMDGRAGNSSIDYQIIVDVKRRGILQVDASLPSRFEYTPMSKPPPASVLRNEAYLAGSEPLGPNSDAEGWAILSRCEIVRGTLFHTRSVLVKFSFALASPLVYTRGSVAPCSLTIQSDDPQALQLFSSPTAPVVYLRRKMSFRASTNEMDRRSSPKGGSTFSEKVPLSVGVWKAASSDSELQSKRCLYGELSLPSNLVPSFTFGLFGVKYFVEVHPFNVAGFTPNSRDRLIRSEIEIVAGYGDGPRPKAYLPPGYIAARERMAAAARGRGSSNSTSS
ncbi:hypothetical protein SCHPADRAFT_994414 [Schizopora paradoxa]|uniref:Arrestin-like N-terminal domain-containing protein n=1 Tax=Schizopora paradoxa TaxID=27342 RepID=A0A0H2SK33_9AGAM|nr:hypothetical protein SCHPADRAFT_994414 [Schizopora paradoxa]